MRGGAVAARRAHNPKVAGSNPAPATIESKQTAPLGPFCFLEARCDSVLRDRPQQSRIRSVGYRPVPVAR